MNVVDVSSVGENVDQKVFSKIPHKCTEVINLAPSMAGKWRMRLRVKYERDVRSFDCCVRFRTWCTTVDEFWRSQHHLLSSVVEVTTVLSQTTDTVESGAVKLAWAAFLSLEKSMITGISQADEQAMTAF